ncbi:PRC-barrel domain-containing protein [Dactylosporangium sp. CS-047395]|uniref:PRC-barrel domain-containing protein n=1 Tax=Dactylosporangium sp. CS-047395 TaxID=3239936 RepID=UPI003D9491C4
MQNLGAPVPYSAVSAGALVFDRVGDRVGVVEHVLADAGSGIFHGLIVRPASLLDGAVFADREQVGGLYEGGVVLTVLGAALHDPGEDAVAAGAADGPAAETIRERLRQAWRWLQQPR